MDVEGMLIRCIQSTADRSESIEQTIWACERYGKKVFQSQTYQSIWINHAVKEQYVKEERRELDRDIEWFSELFSSSTTKS